MSEDLGARLVRAGVATASQVAATQEVSSESGGRTAVELVRGGIWEDAIVGYLLAHGYGPLQQVPDAPSLDRSAADRLPASLARSLVALPLRHRGKAVVVAMADPSDVDAVGRIREACGSEVVPVLARAGEVLRGLEAVYGAAEAHGRAAEAPVPRAPSDDDVVVELVRRREHPAGPVPATESDPVPLVRSKGQRDARDDEDRWESEPPAPLPDPTAWIDAITAAPDRDAAVDLACDAVLSVGRSVAFLAMRKGMLNGFRGKGEGVTNDALRNLRVPVEGASRIGEVARTGEPYDGPHGTGAADAVLRAALGARGTRVVLQPVLVQQRVAGVIFADGVDHGEAGAEVVGRVADAVGESFRRLLLSSKSA